MRLSEAIRLGAMLHPQGFSAPFLWDGRKVVGSCPLGAAHEALGGSPAFPADTPLRQFDALLSRVVQRPRLPFQSSGPARVDAVIMELNDHRRWTREAIADWVETLEGVTPATEGVAVGHTVAV